MSAIFISCHFEIDGKDAVRPGTLTIHGRGSHFTVFESFENALDGLLVTTETLLRETLDIDASLEVLAYGIHLDFFVELR